MAQPPGHNPVGSKAVGGAADLTGKEGYCIKLTADAVVLSAAVGDNPVWVLTHGAAVGSMAGFGNGPSLVWISEAVTAVGQRLRPAADGTWMLCDAASDVIGAVAQQIGAANSFIQAFVLPDSTHLHL